MTSSTGSITTTQRSSSVFTSLALATDRFGLSRVGNPFATHQNAMRMGFRQSLLQKVAHIRAQRHLSGEPFHHDFSFAGQKESAPRCMRWHHYSSHVRSRKNLVFFHVGPEHLHFTKGTPGKQKMELLFRSSHHTARHISKRDPCHQPDQPGICNFQNSHGDEFPNPRKAPGQRQDGEKMHQDNETARPKIKTMKIRTDTWDQVDARNAKARCTSDNPRTAGGHSRHHFCIGVTGLWQKIWYIDTSSVQLLDRMLDSHSNEPLQQRRMWKGLHAKREREQVPRQKTMSNDSPQRRVHLHPSRSPTGQTPHKRIQ